MDDTKLLNWLMFSGAKVCWANDDEFCWVVYHDRDGSFKTDKFFDQRDAIMAAMDNKVEEF